MRALVVLAALAIGCSAADGAVPATPAFAHSALFAACFVPPLQPPDERTFRASAASTLAAFREVAHSREVVACEHFVAAEVHPALAAHCSDGRDAEEAACTELHAMAVDLEQPLCRYRVSDTRPASVRMREDAEGFLVSARDHCVFGRGVHVRNERVGCAGLLAQAVRGFRRAGAIAEADAALALLLDPANGMSATPAAAGLR